jgi:hypothetical protein
MKKTLDALDSIIAQCVKHSASAYTYSLKNDVHPELKSALKGQIKAYNVIKNKCEQKKLVVLAKG